MISIYVTCPRGSEAGKIAKRLLSRKLIACANIFPVQSMFVWKGKLRSIRETALLMKAARRNYKKIEAETKKLHSDEVPCIVAFRWENANPAYKRWVMKNR